MTQLPDLVGRALAAPLGALARRRQGKPMHPRGVVLEGVLERRGGGAWGVPWLDEPGRDAATVRLSRGAGLPAPLPDLLGLAVRVPSAQGPVDLLLSSTGRGRVTRFLPALRRDVAGTYCSIMGYRSGAGTLRLAAWPSRPDQSAPSDPEPLAADAPGLTFTLAVARGRGPWRPFARLVLGAPMASLDPDVAFDAVRHPPPGLTADGPMARLRAPAYAAARAGRGATAEQDRPRT